MLEIAQPTQSQSEREFYHTGIAGKTLFKHKPEKNLSD